MTEHSINRSGATTNSTDEHPDDQDTDDEEQRSEADIKRELRKSVVGRAILSYDRRQRR
jgi:hypothetical protein